MTLMASTTSCRPHPKDPITNTNVQGMTFIQAVGQSHGRHDSCLAEELTQDYQVCGDRFIGSAHFTKSRRGAAELPGLLRLQ
jgi:hypothetical protein